MSYDRQFYASTRLRCDEEGHTPTSQGSLMGVVHSGNAFTIVISKCVRCGEIFQL